MAKLLWGKVYYQDQFAGYLRQEPGERYTFQYDEYLVFNLWKKYHIAFCLCYFKTARIVKIIEASSDEVLF